MDQKKREAISRIGHRLTVDEMLRAEPMKYCAQCGERLPENESVFARFEPGPEQEDEWEMTEVFCRKCIRIDPSRKKRIHPHPPQE